MKKTIKKYFIPHKGNNFLPHILHTKRTIFYGMVFLLMKTMVFGFALSVPDTVFMLPEVLAIDEQKIIQYTNNLRAETQTDALTENAKLNNSAQMKATDMSLNSYFSHKNSDGLGLSYFLKQAGYSYSVAGENLAMGFTDVDDLFRAWEKSPSHYNNLVDSDFENIGVSLAMGKYNGISTVYVVQHFGKPKVAIASAPKLNTKTVVTPPKTTANTTSQEVLNEKIISQPENTDTQIQNVNYFQENSYLSWAKTDTGMKIFANIKATGDVVSAGVYINDYFIPLQKQNSDEFTGNITIKEKPEDFFKVILPGVVKIIDSDKNLTEYSVAWENAMIIGPTPIERYTMAEKKLSPITSVFSFSHNVYLAFLIFFSIALMLNIFIEIRKQHHHIILQTCGLLGLLVIMLVF